MNLLGNGRYYGKIPWIWFGNPGFRWPEIWFWIRSKLHIFTRWWSSICAGSAAGSNRALLVVSGRISTQALHVCFIYLVNCFCARLLLFWPPKTCDQCHIKTIKICFCWWSETSAKLLLVPVGTECLSKTESDPRADSLGKNDRTRPRMHSSLAIVPRRIALGELGYQGYKTTTVRLSWLLIRWLFVCVQFLFV